MITGINLRLCLWERVGAHGGKFFSRIIFSDSFDSFLPKNVERINIL